MNKTIQDIKMEIETVKKSQRETTLELKNLGTGSRVIDASITKRIQEIKERLLGMEDTIDNIDITINENRKSKKLLSKIFQKIQNTRKRANLKIIGIEERDDS
jgi:chromosome segregation ATPase